MVVLAAAPVARAQCTTDWLPGSGAAGVVGSCFRLRAWDPDGVGPAGSLLVAAGAIQQAGSAPVANIAVFDPGTGIWSPLGAGIDGFGFALAGLPNGDLVVGGDFILAGGVVSNHIARWNGSSWSTLGIGMDGPVRALAVLANGDLIAGGDFSMAGGVPAAHVARWNGTSWSPLGSGCDDNVFALITAANGDLIAGGRFATAGGTPANLVARWNGSNWQAVGAVALSGSGSTVLALKQLPSGDLVAGGSFLQAVKLWNGSTWSSMAGGLWSTLSTFAHVADLALLPNGELLAGGRFENSGGLAGPAALNVASWNGSTWAQFGPGVTSRVYSVCQLPGGPLVAGREVASGATVIVWDGSNWVPPNDGFDGQVRALSSAADGSLYAGGSFTHAGSVAASHIARWDGTAWSALGSGTDDDVVALAQLPNGNLVAAGSFTQAGTTAVHGIACWDGATWSSTGLTASPSRLKSLAVLPNGNLFAGGYYFLGMWNGTDWTEFDQTNGYVNFLVVLTNGDLVAGGSMTMVAGVPVHGIARWDGTGWDDMGWSIGSLDALTCSYDGAFAARDSVSGGRTFAHWDGNTWQLLPYPSAATPQPISRLQELPNHDLVALFSGLELSRRHGSSWKTVGTFAGTAASGCMTFHADGTLTVGGMFQSVNGSTSVYLARLATTCPATAGIAAPGCAGSGGNNLLTATSAAWVGGTVATDATGLPAQAIVSVVSGFATQSMPLSSLVPQGQPGCVLAVTGDVLELAAASAGVAHWQTAVPASVSLVGIEFFQQMVPFEVGPGGAILAVTATNALRFVVGSF